MAVTSADGKKQAVVAVGTGSSTLYASLYDGSSWTTANLGAIKTSDYRCFAAAYEQQSGQLVIAAATSTTNQIKYWVHDGSSWVVNGSTYTFNDSDGLYSSLNWLRMDARPDSNQIAMILRANADHVGGLIWNGETNSWGNDKKLSISGATPTASNLCNADVKYMRAGPYKGRAVFVWPNNATTIYSWTWTGAYWESAYKPKTSATSGTILWVELAADPNSSKLLVALGDANDYLYTVDWGGSSWGTARQVSTALRFTTWYGRRFAVAFESGASHKSHAVVAYTNSSNQLKYAHTSDITGAWDSAADHQRELRLQLHRAGAGRRHHDPPDVPGGGHPGRSAGLHLEQQRLDQQGDPRDGSPGRRKRHLRGFRDDRHAAGSGERPPEHGNGAAGGVFGQHQPELGDPVQHLGRQRLLGCRHGSDLRQLGVHRLDRGGDDPHAAR